MQAVFLHSQDFRWLARFLEHLYKAHITTKSPVRLKYFEKFARITEIFFQCLFILYISSVILFLVYPFFMFVTQNELIPLFPLYIPGIDEKTTSGYIILTMSHLYLLILCVMGLLSYDYFNSVVMISSLIFAKLIGWEMDEIHVDLQENATKWRVHGRLRNILQMHQEMFE